MHIGGSKGACLVGAGIAQVGVAGGVVLYHVDQGAFKGVDDAVRRLILLDIDHIQGQAVVAVIAGKGQKLGAVFIICIGAAAQRVLVAEGAPLHHGDIQQLDKLPVCLGQGHIQLILRVGHAGDAVEAPAVPVCPNGILQGKTQVVAGDVGPVMEHMAGVDVKDPALAVLRAGPAGDQLGNDLKIVVQLHHILIDQAADQLVGVVGGNHGIQTVFAVAVEGKNIVRRGGLLHILAPGGLGDRIHRVCLAAFAAGAAQQHQRRADGGNPSIKGFSHKFTSVQHDRGGLAAATALCISVGPVFLMAAHGAFR